MSRMLVMLSKGDFVTLCYALSDPILADFVF